MIFNLTADKAYLGDIDATGFSSVALVYNNQMGQYQMAAFSTYVPPQEPYDTFYRVTTIQ